MPKLSDKAIEKQRRRIEKLRLRAERQQLRAEKKKLRAEARQVLLDRNAEITRHRTQERLTFGQIGKRYGMTRQRVHQIVKRTIERAVQQQPKKGETQ